MTAQPRPIVILCAEDDPDDRALMADALEESKLANRVEFVEDGVELLDYLRRRGRFSPPTPAPRPGLILLDLNMPRKDGREALAEIKADPALRQIPVVILTTSNAEADVFRSYDTGANSYIVKPVSFDRLVDVIRELGRYWVQIVELPTNSGG